VYVGASMASEVTAATMDYSKKIRRDPMAMIPFCGYNMGDYFKHWINIGKRLTHPPKIFHVNWFRVDDKGKFMWPGFGENLRVIEWIINRCKNKTEGRKTPIGYIPTINSLNTKGLDISEKTLNDLLEINDEDWYSELIDIKNFLEEFKERLPDEIKKEHNDLCERFDFKKDKSKILIK